jgi:16S rRNA (cytosine967-C5)-methyltransferase
LRSLACDAQGDGSIGAAGLKLRLGIQRLFGWRRHRHRGRRRRGASRERQRHCGGDERPDENGHDGSRNDDKAVRQNGDARRINTRFVSVFGLNPMTPAARVAAAIEALADIAAKRVPAGESLKDWGRSHRFAGSGDRSSIGGLVYDSLRRKSSSAWIMADDSARASVIGALKQVRKLDADAVSALFTGDGHAPAPLTGEETQRLRNGALDDAPAHVRGDYPEWLAPAFEESFGATAAEEGRALADRAPVDLRVNTLKGNRAKALKALAHLSPSETPFSPLGLRIAIGADGRGPALSAEPAYAKGLVEVQDEGSQIAALLCGARPGWQALDLCAGGGGKSLALAAAMENHGQIHATDPDGRRLTPIFERLERAGARNVQVRAPRGAADILQDLEAKCDLVLVDAPCSGSGAWRRNPDAKWRMRAGALEQRLRDQREAFEQASKYVKKGGRLVYVTCSVLKPENEDQVAAFLAARAEYLPIDAAHLARASGLPAIAAHASRLGAGLRLSPLQTATDGFYICGLVRA